MIGLTGGCSTIPAKPRPGIDGRSPARNALRSMPAQNVPPAPVMTPATSERSSSSRSIASPIATAVSVLIALRASGRLMVTTRTPSTTSVRTLSLTSPPRWRSSAAFAALPCSCVSSQARSRPRTHADGAVQADRLAVEVGVVEDVQRRRRELLGAAQPRRVRNLGGEARLHLVAVPVEDRGVEDAGGDRADPDQLPGEVPRGDEG